MSVSRPRYKQKKQRKAGPGRKFKRGFYQPVNEEKYRQPIDKLMNSSVIPEYRSSWELKMYKWCDNSDIVEYWGTEVVHIIYWDSLQQKERRYYPDIFIYFTDGRKAVVEIKPAAQCKLQNNIDKWSAAKRYCEKINAEFIIMTEKELGIK